MSKVTDDKVDIHYLHLLRVYNDPEFNEDIVRLEELHGDFVRKASLFKKKHGEELLGLIGPIARDWSIADIEVLNYFFQPETSKQEPFPLFNKIPLLVNWAEFYYQDEFTVQFRTDNVSKKDLLELWGKIKQRKLERNKGKVQRSRTSDNDKLVYAVFKARKKGQTFSAIFRDYQNGNLLGYSGNSRQYVSEDSLERFYRKYAPKQPRNITIYDFLNSISSEADT